MYNMQRKSSELRELPKTLVNVAVGSVVLMVVPLVASLVSSEVNWGLTDFLTMGALLFVAGTSYVVLTRSAKSKNKRLAIGIVIAIAFFAVWAELAVGIFD